MRQKLLVAALVLITAAYCWGLGWIAWGFSRAGGAIGWGLALGVAILLALTVWVTWREVLFGMAAGRLAREYRLAPGEEEQLGAEPTAGEEEQLGAEPTAGEEQQRAGGPAGPERAEFAAGRPPLQPRGRPD